MKVKQIIVKHKTLMSLSNVCVSLPYEQVSPGNLKIVLKSTSA